MLRLLLQAPLNAWSLSSLFVLPLHLFTFRLSAPRNLSVLYKSIIRNTRTSKPPIQTITKLAYFQGSILVVILNPFSPALLLIS